MQKPETLFCYSTASERRQLNILLPENLQLNVLLIKHEAFDIYDDTETYKIANRKLQSDTNVSRSHFQCMRATQLYRVPREKHLFVAATFLHIKLVLNMLVVIRRV